MAKQRKNRMTQNKKINKWENLNKKKKEVENKYITHLVIEKTMKKK